MTNDELKKLGARPSLEFLTFLTPVFSQLFFDPGTTCISVVCMDYLVCDDGWKAKTTGELGKEVHEIFLFSRWYGALVRLRREKRKKKQLGGSKRS